MKRPHVLTKAYIRAWADARGTVEVIDITQNRGTRTSVNNATVVRGAYKSLVLMHDLEDEYARIESRGLPVLEKMRRAENALTRRDKDSMISFLDMYLDRSRYADQAGRVIRAVILKADQNSEAVNFSVADRLRLSQGLNKVARLSALGLEKREWRLQPWPHPLVTGDGAVLRFQEKVGAGVCTVAFPVSPTHLLIIGKPLQPPIAINDLIASNCRRWIIGLVGSFKLEP